MSCINDIHFKRTVTHYYSGFKHYKIPFEPADEISAEKVKNVNTYYKAVYNQGGHLIEFSKIYNDKVFFKATYTYRKNGIIEKGIVINADGNTTEQYFDEKGKLIRD